MTVPFEYLERAEARLKFVVPFTLLIVFLLLYLNFRRIAETLIVMLSLPFALIGGPHGKNPELRKMAQKIIKDQEKEIAQMNNWLKKNTK